MDRGPLFRFLADDHVRLGRLLEKALPRPGKTNYGAYAEFRAGLLKHIAMEEKVLLPAARRRRGGEPLPISDKLRHDHGALAALLVPTPTPDILATIRAILNDHNEVEDGPDGVYEVCERLAADEAESLVTEMRNLPDVKLAPHIDGPQVRKPRAVPWSERVTDWKNMDSAGWTWRPRPSLLSRQAPDRSPCTCRQQWR